MTYNIDMAAISALITTQAEAEVHNTFVEDDQQPVFSRPTAEAIKGVGVGFYGHRTVNAFVILADGTRLSHADCSTIVRRHKAIFEGVEV